MTKKEFYTRAQIEFLKAFEKNQKKGHDLIRKNCLHMLPDGTAIITDSYSVYVIPKDELLLDPSKFTNADALSRIVNEIDSHKKDVKQLTLKKTFKDHDCPRKNSYYVTEHDNGIVLDTNRVNVFPKNSVLLAYSGIRPVTVVSEDDPCEVLGYILPIRYYGDEVPQGGIAW